MCFLKNCWLTVNNIIPPCAFVKMDTYHLLLWLWWNVIFMKKYESESLKVGQNTMVLYWTAVKLYVSPKVLVPFQYDQRLCNQKYMINKKWKKEKKNFRCPQSTPLPRLNGRGRLRKPWVINITPRNIFPLETFGNHCMYYSQNSVITLITVFIEIVIIFYRWLDWWNESV